MTSIPQRLPTAAGDRSTLALSALLNTVLGCRLTLGTRLDEDVLRRAARLVLDTEPHLGCYLRESLTTAEWERCETLDARVPFSVVETTNPHDDAVAFHDEPFGETGPRVAVRLLRSGDADDVCIRLDHIAGDGWSTKMLAYLLAETYTRVLVDPDFVPEPNLSPRPSHADLWAALTDEQKAAAKNGPGMAMPRWHKPVSAGPGRGLAARELTLEPRRLSAVRGYGRNRGATVNDMLVAALLRSLARMFPTGKDGLVGASISADLRPFVDNPRFERICTLASPMTIGVAYDTDDAFDVTLDRVVATTRAHKESLWGGNLYGGMELHYRISRGVWRAYRALFGNSNAMPPVVMNIGVLDERRLRFGDAAPTAAHILGSFARVPGFGVTISTYLNTLTVWLGAHQEDVDPAINERVLAGMDEELAAALAGPAAAVGAS